MSGKKERKEEGKYTAHNFNHMAESQNSPSLPSARINSEGWSCGELLLTPGKRATVRSVAKQVDCTGVKLVK